MNTLDALDAQSHADRPPGLPRRRHPQGARPGRRGQPFPDPDLPGRGDPPPGLAACARPSRSARSASASGWSAPTRCNSPVLDRIEVVTRGDVRRAKLYYLRDLRGKKAKIKEKREKVVTS